MHNDAHTVAVYAGAAILAGIAGFIWIGLIALAHDIFTKDAGDE